MSLKVINEYTCDRCSDKADNLVGWAKMVAERHNGPTLGMGKFGRDGYETALDLCPRCVTSLQKWKDRKATT